MSRSSSSYTMRSGMSGAGARSSSVGFGMSSRTSLPAATRALARTAAPSTVRGALEMSFWTWLLERPVASATNRSIRPAIPSGTRTVRMPGATGASGTRRLHGLRPVLVPARRQERGEQEQEDGEADGRISDVEGIEPEVAQTDIDEVDDVADAEPIGHVAECAAEEEPERDGQQRVPAGTVVEPHDRSHDTDRDDREEQCLVAEQPEERARVLRVDEADIVADDLDALTRGQRRDQPRLRQLVEHEDRHCDTDEDRPAGTAPGRAPGRPRRHGAQPSLRSAIVAAPASSWTMARRASAGMSPSRSSASTSSATCGRYDATDAGSPSTHSSMRSSSSSSASRRSSWIARASSRASPSARSASVSSVSRTITSPSSSATAVPGRGVAWISTSSEASVCPAMLTDPSSWNATSPARAAAITDGIA